MWKNSLARGAVSYCVCLAVCNAVSLILGLCGHTMVCTPEFAQRMGNPVVATFTQSMLIGLIGFTFGAGSVLFEIERWSFLRQGAVHLLLTMLVWVGVELFCFRPITWPTLLSFGASAVVTYAATWGAQYFAWRKQVRRLNDQIHQRNEETDHVRH